MTKAIPFLLFALCAAWAGPPCAPGSRILFYSPHPLLDSRTAPGFAEDLRKLMEPPLMELGYCLQGIGDYRTLLDTARFGDNLVLHALASEGVPADFVVAVLPVRDWTAHRLPEAVSRPLVSLPLTRDDPSALMDVLVRKVAENLRKQYVAHVFIQSHPSEALARSTSGLQGRTPVEWILPLGSLSVALEQPGYLPLLRDLDLTVPGQHSYDLQMVKRRFYHSGFIYPMAAFGAAALGAYLMEEHYYAKYQSYGADEQRDRPEIFGRTFGVAKTWERIAYGSAILAGISFAASFRF